MDRAQMNTLEAFIAAMLIVGGLLFASQVTAVTPLSGSTANQHIENQQRAMAHDLLAMTADSHQLHEALVYWNTSGADAPHFHEADPARGYYADLPPENQPLHDPLNATFEHGVYAYNIELSYRTLDGEAATESFVKMGTPSDNAVTASISITLDGTRELTGTGSAHATIADASDADEFWSPNLATGSEFALHTIVEVRLTVWRM